MTYYSVGDDKVSIVSRLKTGLNTFKDLKLPIGEHSIAGFVALSKQLVNIKDAYDEEELRRFSAKLRFLREVDRRTGYRTKQMLAAPVLLPPSGDLIGVIQLINSKSGTPFGALAEEGMIEVCKSVGVAVALGTRRGPDAAGGPIKGLITKYDALVRDGAITAEHFQAAHKEARDSGKDIEEILVNTYQVSLAAIGEALSKFFGVPYEPFKADRVKPLDLIKNLPREYVIANHWVPIDEDKEGVKVLALDPERVKASRVPQNILAKLKINYSVTTHREFIQTLDIFYGVTMGVEDIGDLLSEVGELDDELVDTAADASAAGDNEVVKLVNKVIYDAYQQGTSDIHIESYPGKSKTEIRFRKDGSLVPYIEIPSTYRSALVARIKIMCDLDISERRKPQDGKIKFKRFGPLDIELRVATIPVAGGVEDVVMRILASGEPLPLDKLALSPTNHERLLSVISKPYGLFFVCGPTGSGKTTTLHSVLKHLNQPDTKIWTAEDPVEITQKGLRQVQVNRKAGLDFATVMRSFLRADPDIIMVGEMRDKETTSIGIEASLTGHLVLATLHTNSAPESIIRLLDMGMDPFNFSDALLGVLAQRLAKRLCKCKQAYPASAEEVNVHLKEYASELMNTETFKKDLKAAMEALRADWKKKYANEKGEFILYKKAGCEACSNTGYKGRVGLHELLVGTDEVKRLIQEGARVAQILALALQEGMLTLKMDGVEKVMQGITDLAQVRAVCIK
jgi:type II secretory ATPase GspE/PulE/Tfp pilus assembly ATPase PilB-like protein